MPILVILRALLHNSSYIFVCSLNYSISLRIVGWGFVVLNIELSKQLLCFSLEMQPIIWNNFMRYPISTNDISLNKLSNFLRVQNLIWGSFYPFSEVINSNKYKFMAIGCCWVNLPNNIYSPCRKWLGWSYWCNGIGGMCSRSPWTWHWWHFRTWAA